MVDRLKERGVSVVLADMGAEPVTENGVSKLFFSILERRLLKPNGDPNFNILFYIVNARGEHAGCAMYGEDPGERGWAGQTTTQFVKYAVCDERGPRMENCVGLLPGTASS